jgi:hypothetical protein
MNKQFFQSIFRQDMGYVYKYLGIVPEGESLDHYITSEFADTAGSNSVTTMVTELPTYGITVVYHYSDAALNTNTKFELLTDLVPDPIPEPVEAVLPESEPTQEEQ